MVLWVSVGPERSSNDATHTHAHTYILYIYVYYYAWGLWSRGHLMTCTCSAHVAAADRRLYIRMLLL